MTVVGIVRAEGWEATSLGVHVQNVLMVSGEPEMVRPHATANVAGMSHFETCRYRTDAHLVDEPMRAYVSCVDLEVSVTPDLYVTCP